LNAADEVAVEAFLREEITLPSIPAVIEETLERVPVRQPGSIQEVLEVDEESRSVARQIVRERTQTVYEERGPVSAKV
jgi:1-deoxy-D-xylulose-5-phosphate reductoisomerase